MGSQSGKKTESRFKELFKKFEPMRLQNNIVSHQVTTADYFMQTKVWDIMIECKAISCGTLNILRVTQEYRLTEWVKKQTRNRGYIFFDWCSSTTKNQYMIDIEDWVRLKPKMKYTMRHLEFVKIFRDYNKLNMLLETE